MKSLIAKPFWFFYFCFLLIEVCAATRLRSSHQNLRVSSTPKVKVIDQEKLFVDAIIEENLTQLKLSCDFRALNKSINENAALCFAAQIGKLETFKWLEKNARCFEGQDIGIPLGHAVSFGQNAIVLHITGNYDIQISKLDPACVKSAVLHGHTAVIKTLLRHRLKIDTNIFQDLCKEGTLEMFKLLIERRCFSDIDHETFIIGLILAASYGRIGIIELVLEAKLVSLNDMLAQLIRVAVELDSPELLRLLCYNLETAELEDKVRLFKKLFISASGTHHKEIELLLLPYLKPSPSSLSYLGRKIPKALANEFLGKPGVRATMAHLDNKDKKMSVGVFEAWARASLMHERNHLFRLLVSLEQRRDIVGMTSEFRSDLFDHLIGLARQGKKSKKNMLAILQAISLGKFFSIEEVIQKPEYFPGLALTLQHLIHTTFRPNNMCNTILMLLNYLLVVQFTYKAVKQNYGIIPEISEKILGYLLLL